MKKTFSTYIILFLFMLAYNNVSAMIETKSFSKEITVEKTETIKAHAFLSIADYEKQTGKKLTLGERIKFKIAQKWLKKQAAFSEKSDKKTFSLIALLSGVSSLIFIWIVPVLGLLLGIAGIVFGIIGLKKENAKVMSILGLVLGGLLVLLTALLLIALASFSFV